MNFKTKKNSFFSLKVLLTLNFFYKFEVTFFCYCTKIRLWKFEEDWLKNVGQDRF